MSAHIRQGTIDEPQREAGGDIKVLRHGLEDATIHLGTPRGSIRDTITIRCVSGNRAMAVEAALKRLQEDGPDR
jgi:hypothetical protein